MTRIESPKRDVMNARQSRHDHVRELLEHGVMRRLFGQRRGDFEEIGEEFGVVGWREGVEIYRIDGANFRGHRGIIGDEGASNHAFSHREHTFSGERDGLWQLVTQEHDVEVGGAHARAVFALDIAIGVMSRLVITRQASVMTANFCIIDLKIIPRIGSDSHDTLLETHALPRIFAVYDL